MADYAQLIEIVIEKEKEILGGKTAIKIAQDVPELEINDDGSLDEIKDGGKNALDNLVKKYQGIGGSVSASLIANRLKDEDLEGIDLPERLEARI
jgi:hypothetical protein